MVDFTVLSGDIATRLLAQVTQGLHAQDASDVTRQRRQGALRTGWWRRSVLDGPGRLLTVFGEALQAETARWFLWSPVLIAIGITGYFALPGPPAAALIWSVGSLALAAGLLAEGFHPL